MTYRYKDGILSVYTCVRGIHMYMYIYVWVYT